MKANESMENLQLLNEIRQLKAKKSEIYQKRGPVCPDYISLSLQLNVLMNEYVEGKIANLYTEEITR